MKPTIVFLHPHFLKTAGASRVTLEQAAQIQIRGNFNVKIVTITSNPDVISSYPQLDIINLGGPTTGSVFFWLSLPLFIYRLHQILKPIPKKIIYCHSLAIYWGYLYKLLHPHTVLIYYFNDLGFPYTDSPAEISGLPWYHRLPAAIVLPLFSLVNHAAASEANYLIANSRTSANFIYRKYRRLPETVVYPGINISLLRRSKVKHKVCFTVGRLEKIKKIDLVIDAFNIFSQNHPEFNLIIIGQGIEKSALQQQINHLQLNSKIKFMGQVSPKTVSQVASSAAFGVFPCPHESFGMSVLETIASGTPVVCANQGGAAEILAQVPFGITTNNTAPDFATAMENILNTKFSINHKKIMAIYSWNQQGITLNSFFESIPLSN